MAKELKDHSMFVPRGNDLCVQNHVTQADEFLPSGRSDAPRCNAYANHFLAESEARLVDSRFYK